MFSPLPFRPSWIFSPPYPTFGEPLSIHLQPLSGPSPFFVALRGYLFAFVPFVDPLRGYLFPLVSFFVALHGPLSSLFQPLGVPSRTPFPTFGEPLSIPLQPLRGPSPFFVALRGHVFAFSFSPFVEIFLPFPSRSSFPFVDNSFPLRALRGSPSWISFFLRVHSCPFVVLPAPSWIPSSKIVITFHHFKPPRGLSPICARIPLKRRLIPQVRAFAPAPPPFPFGRRAPAG